MAYEDLNGNLYENLSETGSNKLAFIIDMETKMSITRMTSYSMNLPNNRNL